MSTPIGHLLGGTLAASAAAGESAWRDRRLLLRILLLALLPDADALVLLVVPTAHRGVSHGLPFAAVAAAALVALGGRRLSLAPARAWLALFLAAASHPVLDALMGAGPPVPFLAPFSQRGWLFPVRVVPTAYYAKVAHGYLLPSFWILNGAAALLEAGIFGGALVAARPDAAPRARILGAVTAGAALALSIGLYAR